MIWISRITARNPIVAPPSQHVTLDFPPLSEFLVGTGQDRGDKRAPEGDQLPAFPRLGPAGSSPGERLVVLERISLSLRAQCCVQ